jgi:hypothetical protein
MTMGFIGTGNCPDKKTIKDVIFALLNDVNKACVRITIVSSCNVDVDKFQVRPRPKFQELATNGYTTDATLNDLQDTTDAITALTCDSTSCAATLMSLGITTSSTGSVVEMSPSPSPSTPVASSSPSSSDDDGADVGVIVGATLGAVGVVAVAALAAVAVKSGMFSSSTAPGMYEAYPPVEPYGPAYQQPPPPPTVAPSLATSPVPAAYAVSPVPAAYSPMY